MFREDYTELREEADKYIQAERRQYLDVYKVIDKYIANEEILVGGQMGVNLLYGIDNSENYSYDLFTSNAFKHANELSNKLTKRSPGRIVRLVTVAPYKVYHIFVDTRMMVALNGVKVRSGTNYLRLVEPVEKPLRTRKVLVVSPEIQLLDIYRKLYLPNYAGEWEKLVNNETKMFSMVLSRKQKIKKEGGATPQREKIDGALMDYISQSNKLLIGDHACEILLGIKSTANFIEVLSFAPLQDDIEEIKMLVKKITSEPVNASTRNLEVIGDYRLSRTTIKLGHDRPKEILYIYNSTDYDLIPYNILESTSRTLWIANPFVILRFLLVNMWMIRRVRELGLIDEKFAAFRINGIFEVMIELRKKLVPPGELLGSSSGITKELIASDHPLSVFQENRYVGTFISEDIAFKIERTQSRERYHDYYPIDYKEKFGSFREL